MNILQQIRHEVSKEMLPEIKENLPGYHIKLKETGEITVRPREQQPLNTNEGLE